MRITPKHNVWASATFCGLLLVQAAAYSQFFGGETQREPVAEPPVPTKAEVEQSIEDTRDLLTGGTLRPTRPWYDAQTDGVRRLDMKAERKLPSWNLSWLGNLLGPLVKGMGWAAVVVVVLLLALILWRVINHWRSGHDDSDANLTLDDDANCVDRVEELPFQIARQATDLLSEARRHYEASNFNEAIIYLFSHELVELDKQHLIYLARGKTNRQLVRELGQRRELRLLAEQTMVAFEDVFFGDHELSRARFEACWFELERFDRLVREAIAS